MKKHPVIFLLCTIVYGLWSIAASAQTIHRCATQEIYEQNVRKHPGYDKAVEHAFNYAKGYASNAANKTGNWDTIYRIPVVVHVVYNTPEQNLDDSLICSQIEVLNQDYRRLNADTGNTRDVFKSVAADAGIEFFLATTDPEGNPTTGVTRTYTDTPYFSVIGDIFSGSMENGADKVKKTATGGIDAWDTDKYLNIWTCNMKDPNSLFGLVLGFSYPPDGAPNWPAEAFPADSTLQGVVIHYEVFGRKNPAAAGPLEIADAGRTVVHEVGHFLGLRHIWGDGLLSILFADCSADDGIDDTPNSGNNSQATGCDSTKNTCDEGNPDLPDMWENYMDYSREECQNIFTQGQAAIMRAMLATSRSGLPVFEMPAASTLCAKPASAREISDSQNLFSVYPNPAQGVFTVQVASAAKNPSWLVVSDVFGKEVKRLNAIASGSGSFTVPAGSLPKGVYFLRLESKESSFVRKIVVE